MTVEQTGTIDMVSLDRANGLCRLKVIDHLPWNDEHLANLQAKINTCLQFIESGEIYIVYPLAQGLGFSIDLQFIFAPGAEALAFLAHARQVLDDAGYELHFGPMGSAYADAASMD